MYMYELFSAFFPILTSFSLKPLTRNHSYIMVYYVFLIRVCDDHSATWHFYLSIDYELNLPQRGYRIFLSFGVSEYLNIYVNACKQHMVSLSLKGNCFKKSVKNDIRYQYYHFQHAYLYQQCFHLEQIH